MRDITNAGGAYEARVGIATSLPISIEGAYIGTAQDIQALGLDSKAVLVSNGVEGDLRFNFTRTKVQPFVTAGAAYQHYSITNESFNTSSVKNSDNVWSIPVGVGVASRFGGGFTIDARFVYRPTYGAELLRTPAGSTATDGTLNNWTATARLGYEF
jgi:opacity protein-like surface antigen